MFRSDVCRQFSWFLQCQTVQVLDVSDGLKTFCGQKLDHFDSDSTKTWCQRYTTNRTYWKAGGPVFVCIDGEDYPWGGSRKPYTLMCNNMMELLGSEIGVF